MELLDIRPIIWTEQMEETIKYYSEVLGFICDEYNKKLGWASLSKDDVGIMVTKPNTNALFKGPIFTGSLYFAMDNVDELWNQLKDKAKICYPIENFEYGMRDFAIYDNNGYMLQFGEEIQKE